MKYADTGLKVPAMRLQVACLSKRALQTCPLLGPCDITKEPPTPCPYMDISPDREEVTKEFSEKIV